MSSTVPQTPQDTGRSDALEVRLLGVVDFDSALLLQDRLLFEISGRDDRHGAVLLCEHPPLITIGREGSRADLLRDPVELEAARVPVRWVNRGGGAFTHAPGQLAVYPILPLDRLGLGVGGFRQQLEAAAAAACSELRVPAWTEPDEPGLVCRGGRLAMFGAAVRRWVSCHGLFLNVAPDLQTIRLSRPLGRAERLTSLAAERRRPLTMHAVRSSLIRHIAAAFGYERCHVFSGHSWLKPTRRKVYVPA